MLNSLTLDSNKNVTNWILTGISPEKIKHLDPVLAPIMSILANGRVSIKFTDSVLMQKNSSSLYTNFVVNLYMVHELNNWPNNPSNNFTLKKKLFNTVKLTRNAIKSKFIYSAQGMAFERARSWSFGNNFARNIVIFSVNNS